MTAQPQPQPTAADEALSDSELIDAFETTVIHNSRTWDADIQSRIRATRVELMRRLARAESAPGVTIPQNLWDEIVETLEWIRELAYAGEKECESDQWFRIIAPCDDLLGDIDAALADAGTDSGTGVTISTDIAIYAHTILGDMGPDEVDGDSWPTHVATVRILGDAIDTAQADAGTASGTGA